MSSGGGGGSSTQTQKIDPWMKDQIQKNMGRVDAIAADGYQPYACSFILMGSADDTIIKNIFPRCLPKARDGHHVSWQPNLGYALWDPDSPAT